MSEDKQPVAQCYDDVPSSGYGTGVCQLPAGHLGAHYDSRTAHKASECTCTEPSLFSPTPEHQVGCPVLRTSDDQPRPYGHGFGQTRPPEPRSGEDPSGDEGLVRDIDALLQSPEARSAARDDKREWKKRAEDLLRRAATRIAISREVRERRSEAAPLVAAGVSMCDCAPTYLHEPHCECYVAPRPAEVSPEVFIASDCERKEHARCDSHICGCDCHDYPVPRRERDQRGVETGIAQSDSNARQGGAAEPSNVSSGSHASAGADGSEAVHVSAEQGPPNPKVAGSSPAPRLDSTVTPNASPTTFKVGDRVRMKHARAREVRNDDALTGEVVGVNGLSIFVKDSEGDTCEWMATSLVRDPEATPSSGDATWAEGHEVGKRTGAENEREQWALMLRGRAQELRESANRVVGSEGALRALKIAEELGRLANLRAPKSGQFTSVANPRNPSEGSE